MSTSDSCRLTFDRPSSYFFCELLVKVLENFSLDGHFLNCNNRLNDKESFIVKLRISIRKELNFKFGPFTIKLFTYLRDKLKCLLLAVYYNI